MLRSSRGGLRLTVALAAVIVAHAASAQPGGRAQARPMPAPRPAVPATPAQVAPCPDPLVGLWVGRRLVGGTWSEHRVSLERIGTSYACQQEARSWVGDASSRLPPRCPAGGRDYTITRLRCAVRVVGRFVTVQSTRLDEQLDTCGGDVSGYNFDRLEGVVDANTWHADNDDGGIDQHARYEMRRLSCTP